MSERIDFSPYIPERQEAFFPQARAMAIDRFQSAGEKWTWAEESKWESIWEVAWQRYEKDCGEFFIYHMNELAPTIFEDAWNHFVKWL